MTIARTDLDASDSPFRGLAPFTDSDRDARAFSGRELETELVTANLLASRLTLLHGPSGVGKSSLLRAGVVRRAHDMVEDVPDPEASVRSSVVVLFDDWSRAITSGLLAAIGDTLPAVWRPGADAGPLSRELEELCRARRVELLLLLDHFEDYLYGRSPGGDEDREMTALLGSPSLPIHVLLGLRDDALGELDRFKGRVPHLFEVSYRLEGLTRAAARRAVEEPVAHYRDRSGAPLELDPQLVDAVIDELTRRGPGNAGRIEPVHLQLVMTRVWHAERTAGSSELRASTLRSLGGAEAIIARHVEETMSRMPSRRRRLAASILGHLVTPSHVALRFTATDLAHYTGEDEPSVAGLLDELASGGQRILRAVDAPLASGSRLAYEIFHDTLARPVLEWSRAYERRRLQQRAARLTGAVIALAAIALGLAIYVWNPVGVRRIELAALDARFAVRGPRPPDPRVALLGLPTSFGRSEDAAIIHRLQVDGARVIAFDVVFDARSTSRRADARLKASIRSAASRLVLATTGAGATGASAAPRGTNCGAPSAPTRMVRASTILASPGFIERTHASSGFAAFPNDPGPVLRRVSYSITVGFNNTIGILRYPSFAACAATLGHGRRLTGLPTGSRATLGTKTPGDALIDYSGGPGRYRPLQAREVLSGSVPRDALQDKIVVVGYTDDPGDQHRTATTDHGKMSGPEVQANAIATLLDGARLRDVPVLIDVFVLILGVCAPVALWLLPLPPTRLLALPAVPILLLVGIQVGFSSGHVFAVVAPVVASVGSVAAILAFEVSRHITAARLNRRPAPAGGRRPAGRA